MKNTFLNTASEILLSPLALLWDGVYRVRRAAYRYGGFKQYAFKVPIISIGNLSFGGTGKTPFTLWLAENLAKRGKKVMILMRGYKGKLEHQSGILRGGARIGSTPLDFGDEAILLSRRLPEAAVVVGKNRVQNLEKYFDEVRPDVVLLDDGHQHLRMARQLNFVFFDALMPMSRLRVAPLGHLREGLTALVDADMVVLSRVDHAPQAKVQRLKETLVPHLEKEVPFAEVDYQAIGLLHDHASALMPVSELMGRKVICVAGIASPASFFRLVDNLGANIIKTVSYPDHHDFKVAEIQQLLALASENNALIITTEKDIVKVRRITDDRRIHFLEIGIAFRNGEEHVWELIENLFKKYGI